MPTCSNQPREGGDEEDAMRNRQDQSILDCSFLSPWVSEVYVSSLFFPISFQKESWDWGPVRMDLIETARILEQKGSN